MSSMIDIWRFLAHTNLTPAAICQEAMTIAASLCVYTNSEIVIDELCTTF